MYIEIITDQNISGLYSINLGPGETFKAIKAPNKIAVVPEPGIPRVNKGTNDPVQAALLALSGAANPLTDTLPNNFLSSLLAMFLSTAYPRKDAIVPPVQALHQSRNLE